MRNEKFIAISDFKNAIISDSVAIRDRQAQKVSRHIVKEVFIIVLGPTLELELLDFSLKIINQCTIVFDFSIKSIKVEFSVFNLIFEVFEKRRIKVFANSSGNEVLGAEGVVDSELVFFFKSFK